MTWVTPGELLLRYAYDARALVEGDIAWPGGATVPPDTSTCAAIEK